MHTRRLASFLIGAWLLGSLLIAFVMIPGMQRQTEAILAAPPSAIAKDIDDLGPDVARLMLDYQVAEATRFIEQIWGIAQLGLAGALLAAVVFTAHRSKFLIATSAVMAVLVCLQTLYILPTVRATGRVIDFLPPAAVSPARATNHSFQVWYQVCEVLKFLGAVGLAGRLVIDFYTWRDREGETTAAHSHRRRHRRIHSRQDVPAEPEAGGATDSAATAD